MAGLPPGVKEVQRIAAPGGGYYVVGSDGGVFAIADDNGKTPAFYGSVPGMQGDTLAGQHQFGANALTLNPGGGYSLADTAGHQYGFDTNYAKANGLQVPDQASTLPSDPAFLAFMRSSGLGLETAANQVQQQTGNINAALTTATGDLNHSYDQSQDRIGGSYEARGIGKSGESLRGLNENEYQRGKALSNAQSTAANQISTLNQGLVAKVLDQRSKAAELGLSTGQNQDLDASQTAFKTKYAKELAGGGLTP